MPMDAEVVIPLRWDGGPEELHTRDVAEMAAYLHALSRWADVTVVDGSRADRFSVHHRAWGHLVRHLRPTPRPGVNGKVLGALAGVEQSRHERVVLADDDVRYDRAALRAVVDLLDEADLVRPANVFTSWPWHARWDGSRSLLNRALAADWPGTFGLRRSTVMAMGGWDPDVLFENLELVRSVRAWGGVVRDAPHVLVGREPPTAQHFWDQRVRQAYDDLAQPWRLVGALATVPLAVLLRRRPRILVALAGGLVAVAEAGRRTAGARTAVPTSVSMFAPVWVLERGICSWLALAAAAQGGVPYRDGRIATAAHTTASIRRRQRRLARLPSDSAPSAAFGDEEDIRS